MTNTPVHKIPVGISACLMGQAVRYDGGHKAHAYVLETLSRYFEFHAFCPEVEIGLGVPRTPIRLVRRDGELICVSAADHQTEYTDSLRGCADQQCSWVGGLCGYIFKKKSPSCGLSNVKVYDGEQIAGTGRGIYAARLMALYPLLPVVEEDELDKAELRENFIRRVSVLYRWRTMLAGGLSVAALGAFHARHHAIVLDHCPQSARELADLLSRVQSGTLDEAAERYLVCLMRALRAPVSLL